MADILEYRSIGKLLSTYIEALPQEINPHTGRIHTSFNQTLTATGRLSSSNPNLQNIPVRTPRGQMIRRAFVASSDDIGSFRRTIHRSSCASLLPWRGKMR